LDQGITMDQHEKEWFAGAVRPLSLQGEQPLKQFLVVEAFRGSPSGVPYVSIRHQDCCGFQAFSCLHLNSCSRIALFLKCRMVIGERKCQATARQYWVFSPDLLISDCFR
jgi:hypothetical protein